MSSLRLIPALPGLQLPSHEYTVIDLDVRHLERAVSNACSGSLEINNYHVDSLGLALDESLNPMYIILQHGVDITCGEESKTVGILELHDLSGKLLEYMHTSGNIVLFPSSLTSVMGFVLLYPGTTFLKDYPVFYPCSFVPVVTNNELVVYDVCKGGFKEVFRDSLQTSITSSRAALPYLQALRGFQPGELKTSVVLGYVEDSTPHIRVIRDSGVLVDVPVDLDSTSFDIVYAVTQGDIVYLHIKTSDNEVIFGCLNTRTGEYIRVVDIYECINWGITGRRTPGMLVLDDIKCVSGIIGPGSLPIVRSYCVDASGFKLLSNIDVMLFYVNLNIVWQYPRGQIVFTSIGSLPDFVLRQGGRIDMLWLSFQRKTAGEVLPSDILVQILRGTLRL